MKSRFVVIVEEDAHVYQDKLNEFAAQGYELHHAFITQGMTVPIPGERCEIWYPVYNAVMRYTQAFAFQSRVAEWARKCFGEEMLMNTQERALRLLEEAIEVAQSVDVSVEDVERSARVIYARPKGEAVQEMGGIFVTALAMCEALSIYCEDVTRQEVERIESKSVEHFRARNKEKADLGISAFREATS